MMLIKYYIVLFIRHISTKLTYSAYQLSVFIYHIEQAFDFHTPGIYLFKVNNWNTKTKQHFSGVFIIAFEQVNADWVD